MITMKEFTEALKWSMKEFNAHQVKDIFSAIQTESFQSLDELREAEENEGLDCNYSYDANLVPLLENLDGYDEQQIVDLINNPYPYSPSISIYYLQQDEMYAMIIGHQ